MANRQRQRILSRVNTHTSQEAERTREVIITELQPLTSLVNGDGAHSIEERIKARNNQIALLQAANREDREAMRKERVATREASAKAKAEAKAEKRRRTSSASGSTRAPSTPTPSSDSSSSSSSDEEQEVAIDSVVQAKVDRLMADMDARRDSK